MLQLLRFVPWKLLALYICRDTPSRQHYSAMSSLIIPDKQPDALDSWECVQVIRNGASNFQLSA
jgi:hypothetical protein